MGVPPDNQVGLRDLLHGIDRQLDRIERKAEQKADAIRLEAVEERLRRLEVDTAKRLDLEDLEARVLSRDSIGQMIGTALQQADSRGWTMRERRMAVAAFAILIVNFVVGLLTLGPDVWH